MRPIAFAALFTMASSLLSPRPGSAAERAAAAEGTWPEEGGRLRVDGGVR
jgi:hypothetical protein